jgi:hypothetical protein
MKIVVTHVLFFGRVIFKHSLHFHHHVYKYSFVMMNSHHSLDDHSAGAENPAHSRVSHTDSVLGNEREHFPIRLYVKLKSDDDFHSIVSWSADGLSFSIHQKDIFIERIVPKYFKMTKFCSFGSTITISLVLNCRRNPPLQVRPEADGVDCWEVL